MDTSNHQPVEDSCKLTLSSKVKIPRQWATKPIIRPGAAVPYCVEGSGSNPTWEMGIISVADGFNSPQLLWKNWRIYFAIAALLGEEGRRTISFCEVCEALDILPANENYRMIRQSLRMLHAYWVRRHVDGEMMIESPLLCVSEIASKRVNNRYTPHQFIAEIPENFREMLKDSLAVKFENIRKVKSRHAALLMFFLPAWAARCGEDNPCAKTLTEIGEILELPDTRPGSVRNDLLKNKPSILEQLDGMTMKDGRLRVRINKTHLLAWRECAAPSDGKIKNAYKAGGGDLERYDGYVSAGRGLSAELEKRIYALGVPPRYHKFLDICSRLLSVDSAIMEGVVQIAEKDHKARYKVRNPGALFATRLLNVVKGLPKARNSKFWQDAAACKEQKEAKKNDAKKGNR